jgi:hypothetical protein
MEDSGSRDRTVLTDGRSLEENPPVESREGLMDWECIEDKQNRGDWRVEAIDHENEGQVYVAIFSGPDARERAQEYAALKNHQESRSMRIAS